MHSLILCKRIIILLKFESMNEYKLKCCYCRKSLFCCISWSIFLMSAMSFCSVFVKRKKLLLDLCSFLHSCIALLGKNCKEDGMPSTEQTIRMKNCFTEFCEYMYSCINCFTMHVNTPQSCPLFCFGKPYNQRRLLHVHQSFSARHLFC